MSRAFEDVPQSVRGHFHLNIFAAIYHLIGHLRRLGEDLDAVFQQYPFLGGYFGEMLAVMPDDLTWEEAPEWWAREIAAWEAAIEEPLPLVALATAGGVDFRRRLALLLVGLVEEDSRFGTLFAHVQAPLAHRRPELELVGQVLADGSPAGADPWSICRPLLEAGLVEVIDEDAPRSEWVLRVPSMLWDAMRGETVAHPAPGCRAYAPDAFAPVPDLIFPDAFREQLLPLPALVETGKAQAIVLRGTPGSERLPVLGAVARALERGVVVVDGTIPAGERVWAHLGPFCIMTRALPAIRYELGPGETVDAPPLPGYRGPVGFLMGTEGGLRGPAMDRAVTLTLPLPRTKERKRIWQTALDGHPVADPEAIAERFHLPGGYIRQAAGMAVAHAGLAGSETVTVAHVRAACRALNRQLLDTLAARLKGNGTWDQLVLSDVAAARLQELERRCRHRERLLDHLGAAFSGSSNRGVRALFTGVSGTGKTLAARILAAELEMDLYRVDLSAVVNKYIGETEKNLHRILSRAEALDVVLLLDEGDALLGSRTDVRSANDRYANLETNYLLQRLEQYEGIVLVTSNLGENIDRAFQRRMDVVVHFISPGPEERWHIWQLHLPEAQQVAPDVLERVTVQCALTGGQIRNAAVQATLLALDDGGVVADGHLLEAVRSEYRKAGATCPLTENGAGGGPGRGRRQNGVAAFFEAMAE